MSIFYYGVYSYFFICIFFFFLSSIFSVISLLFGTCALRIRSRIITNQYVKVARNGTRFASTLVNYVTMGRKTNSSTGYLPDTLVGDASTGCDAGASIGLMMLGLLTKVK
jgi:hypothetical protein